MTSWLSPPANALLIEDLQDQVAVENQGSGPTQPLGAASDYRGR
jgi:hypothetical protein